MLRKNLQAVTARFDHWLHTAALPLWWEQGADHTQGGYHELLGLDGKPAIANRRARVQSRQSYVYSMAGAMGWQGPWRQAAPHGIDYLVRRYNRESGQFCTLVSPQGDVLDSTTLLYDQAFALLAMASVVKVLPERTDLKERAHALIDTIRKARQHPAGGFVETGAKRFISNPHMHFLEAMLAWCEVEPDAIWGDLADHVANLALTKFIDSKGGFLREYFDEHWAPAPGDDGHVVEPGHQFEWAWLLTQWGRIRRHPEVRTAALRLFENGVRGIDAQRDAAVHAMNDGFAVTVPTARLWAQTERIKAALVLAKGNNDPLLDQALRGAATLWRYFETPTAGLWRDRFEPDGKFAEEPAPASTFYHIICCIACMKDAAKAG